MSKELHIDGIDKIILRHLTEDARTPILKISREIGISGAAIHQRLNKLEEGGLFNGSKFIINSKTLGYNTLAFVGIYLNSSDQYKSVIRKLKEIPEVIESHYTTGNYGIFIKVLSKNNEHLMELLSKKIQAIEGVSRTETFISLDQEINRQIQI
ncbi:MAG: Lrp/AsnC ligand binding domain-containing protein [Flavobacteriaceae bacterium]|nr:Lrp/AsnC ligand binding domain-containing protein [Flavobacteriaceae bacterium]